MTENKQPIDVWTVGVLYLWLTMFIIGLFPETAFMLLRETGRVVTIRALVNSHWFITLACAGYLGWFVFNRFMECGDATDVAFGKSVQIIILGITAFLPLHMEQAHLFFSIGDPFYRYLILSVIGVKALAWFYLVTLLLRYYLISGHAVFKNIPLLFPSALLDQQDIKESPAPAAEQTNDPAQQ